MANVWIVSICVLICGSFILFFECFEMFSFFVYLFKEFTGFVHCVMCCLVLVLFDSKTAIDDDYLVWLWSASDWIIHVEKNHSDVYHYSVECDWVAMLWEEIRNEERAAIKTFLLTTRFNITLISLLQMLTVLVNELIYSLFLQSRTHPYTVNGWYPVLISFWLLALSIWWLDLEVRGQCRTALMRGDHLERDHILLV